MLGEVINIWGKTNESFLLRGQSGNRNEIGFLRGLVKTWPRKLGFLSMLIIYRFCHRPENIFFCHFPGTILLSRPWPFQSRTREEPFNKIYVNGRVPAWASTAGVPGPPKASVVAIQYFGLNSVRGVLRRLEIMFWCRFPDTFLSGRRRPRPPDGGGPTDGGKFHNRTPESRTRFSMLFHLSGLTRDGRQAPGKVQISSLSRGGKKNSRKNFSFYLFRRKPLLYKVPLN